MKDGLRVIPTLSEQMAQACARGAGGDPAELMGLVERGEAQLISLGSASASWRQLPGAEVEVLHAWGGWEDMERLHRMAVLVGVTGYRWEGRRGWTRAIRRLERED